MSPKKEKRKNVSCEIEEFVETHLFKLRGILRSRVLRDLCDLIKNVSPYGGEQNLTAVELSVRMIMLLLLLSLLLMVLVLVIRRDM